MVVLSRALNLTASAPIIAQGVADAVKRLDRYFYEDDAQQDENKASLFTADDATSSYIILTADSAVKEHVLAVQTAERVRTRAPPMAQNVFTIAEWIGSNALIAPIANLFTSTTKPRVADVDKKVGALLKDISEVVPKGVAKAALALLPPV